jgi:hypothetical protein
MEPLDLSKHAPRSPHERLDGLCILPRSIDKARATLPGGNLGPYQLAPGLSFRMLQTLGVTPEDFTAAVAAAQDDAEVAAWLRQHADTEKYAQVNEFSTWTQDDISPERRARFESLYSPEIRAQHPILFDLLDADDNAMFPGS